MSRITLNYKEVELAVEYTIGNGISQWDIIEATHLKDEKDMDPEVVREYLHNSNNIEDFEEFLFQAIVEKDK